MRIRELEISELNRYIKNVLSANPILSRVRVRGEISNFKIHSSGNVYLSLKDEKSKINCVIFRTNYKDIGADNGSKVVCEGYISVYERDGSYQLYIEKMELEGIGQLYIRYMELKKRLEGEGLFSPMYKRSIPKFPKKIGVVTSPTGAVIRDILNVVKRRYPKIEILLFPALVQGEGSVKSLLDGLDYFEREKNVDTIIIGRGGGSLEELWSFNDEDVARKIFSMSIPVISAVGHETDFTICDFVADMRAPTPSAAAEIATPNLEDLYFTMENTMDRMGKTLRKMLEYEKQNIKNKVDKATTYIQRHVLSQKFQDLDILKDSLDRSETSLIDRKRTDLESISFRLGGLNPFGVMDRGYSIITKNGEYTTAENIDIGDEIEVRLKEEVLECRVENKNSINPLDGR